MLISRDSILYYYSYTINILVDNRYSFSSTLILLNLLHKVDVYINNHRTDPRRPNDVQVQHLLGDTSEAKQTFPHLGAKIAATFSLPSFYEKFSAESGISEASLDAELRNAVALFTKAILPTRDPC